MANVLSGDTKVRVYNKAKYDVGVRLLNGLSFNIAPNSFQLMTINDVLFIESIAPNAKFFSKKILVPTSELGKEIDISETGLMYDMDTHLNDDEIIAALKMSVKKFETWLNEITEPSELHAIYEVAKNIDELPLNKIRLLKEKMPDEDWLDEMT